jgi:hypothetical protein
MKKTNFPKFLAEQMKEPGFAATFRKAGAEWDRKLRRPSRAAARRKASGKP